MVLASALRDVAFQQSPILRANRIRLYGIARNRKNCWHAHCGKYFREIKSWMVLKPPKDITRIKLFWLCGAVYLLVIALSVSYNIYTSFFPISMGLHIDEAEHLHVAFLLSEGQKPFVDFIENHPTLFNHYLRWLRDITGVTTTRDWAFYARTTIFAHFLVCLVVFCCWTSNLISHRPRGWPWIGLLVCAWGMEGLYNSCLYTIGKIRPDWICYAYTLLGCYLFYLHFRHRSGTGNGNSYRSLLVLGGILIGGWQCHSSKRNYYSDGIRLLTCDETFDPRGRYPT